MTTHDWRAVAKTILASRRIDEIEEQELVPAGKVTYQFSAKGHELPQVLLAHALTNPHDAATVYYRSRPFVLHAGMTYKEAFCGPLANNGSRNGGRDIGVVHNLTPRSIDGRHITVFPTSGDVGAQYTPAAGYAQAIVYRHNELQEESYRDAIAVALAGDASVATNGFWSALTMATTLSLPMIFLIEDNNFGISVRGHLQTPGSNIAANLASFKNLYILDGDGSDPEQSAAFVQDAVTYARTQRKPVLLRLTVPRICGHSGADSQVYKSQEERNDELKRDPIPLLEKYLIAKKILTKKQWQELVEEVESEVRIASQDALSEIDADSSTVNHYAFYDSINRQTIGGQYAEGYIPPVGMYEPEQGMRVNLLEAVKRTLASELATNNKVVVFGEDVGMKGGVHGATIDLQTQFGESRVFDTSLSEEGIIGRSLGLAYAGLVPVPEIQFRKYLDPAMEQVNDCGTIRWRTNNQFAAPMVLRIPVGYSKRTGDPWHSVSGEAIFAHTIGWYIAFPSNARDAAGLLRTALRGNDPTFFLEHRNLLDTTFGRALYPGDSYQVEFGKASIVRKGTKATIVTWGDMVYRSLEAVEQLQVDVEIIDLRTIIPWDRDLVLTSVKKTSRCLIVHEDCITNGFGAEISSVITQEAFSWLDAPVIRFATNDIPVPYNKNLMSAVIPNGQTIATHLQKLLSF